MGIYHQPELEVLHGGEEGREHRYCTDHLVVLQAPLELRRVDESRFRVEVEVA